MEKLVIELARRCRKQKHCDGCPLSFNGDLCRLRLMSLPDVAKSLFREVSVCSGVLWVRYSTKDELKADLPFWEGLQRYQAGVDENRLEIRLYASDTNELLSLRPRYGDGTLQAALERFGERDVKLIVDSVRGGFD